MKIILVSRCAWSLYNFRAGLVRALVAQGVTVIGAGAAEIAFQDKVRSLGVPFHELPIDKRGINPIADLWLFWVLYRWYRQEKPDVVHHFMIKPVIYGSLAAYLAGVPRIVNTISGLGYVFTEGNQTFLRKVVEVLYRMALSVSHLTFFLNLDDLSIFRNRNLVSEQGSALLPGEGVDTQHFKPDEGRVDGVHKNIVFLMIARLLKDKGIREYVEAARIVKAELPFAKFCILGEPDGRNPSSISKEKMLEWCDEGVVEWLDSTEDVRPIIARADVVVLPSYREGVPRTLLEAAAMGKPLVATDVPGCREVVRQGVNGFLVPVKDAHALADAMLTLAQDEPARAAMGKAGREIVVREFDESIVISKMMVAYFI